MTGRRVLIPVGVVLLLVGIVGAPVSCIGLAGIAFTTSGWNATHQLDLTPGKQQTFELAAKAGEELRPTIYLLVDREPFRTPAGEYELSGYDFPARWRLLDPNGVEVQRWEGSIVKNGENVAEGGTAAVAETASVERFFAPFVANEGTYRLDASVEADRGGKLAIIRAYLLVYDRSSPTLMKAAIAVVLSILALIGGVVMLVLAKRSSPRASSRGSHPIQ